MIKEFHFTGKELKELGWDGNPNTLEDFNKRVKTALKLDWDPNEENLNSFEKKVDTYKSMGWKPSNYPMYVFEREIEESKKLGWNEKVMSYKDFQKKLDTLDEKGWKHTKQNLNKLDKIIEEYKRYGWNGKGSLFDFECRVDLAKEDGWDPDIVSLKTFEKIQEELDDLGFNPKKITLKNFFKMFYIIKSNGWDETISQYRSYANEIIEYLYSGNTQRDYFINEDIPYIELCEKVGWHGKIEKLKEAVSRVNYLKKQGWDEKEPIFAFILTKNIEYLGDKMEAIYNAEEAARNELDYVFECKLEKYLMSTRMFSNRQCNAIIRELCRKKTKNIGRIEDILRRYYGGDSYYLYNVSREIVKIINSRRKILDDLRESLIPNELKEFNENHKMIHYDLNNSDEFWEKEFSSYDDDDDKDNLQERRRRAEQLGWDEAEMDLEEFEDYYM